MKYMLDTDTCIYAIKRRGNVLDQILAHDPAEICISAITYSELNCGVEKSSSRERNRIALLSFLAEIEVEDYDDLAAEEYGTVRAALERRGEPIGAMDLLIAAHARSIGATVVTNNTREFGRVDELRMENWL